MEVQAEHASQLLEKVVAAAHARISPDMKTDTRNPSVSQSQRALFLDRDGIMNEEVGYLWKPEDVQFVPGVINLCRAARTLGYRLIVVTNQAGIARGYYTEADFLALMEWMRAELRREGVELDAVYYCPFHPEHGVGGYKRESFDRKPQPGMLLRGKTEFGLDMAASVFVGDRCTDVGAGNAAGVGRMFLLKGTEVTPCVGKYVPVDSLARVMEWLVEMG